MSIRLSSSNQEELVLKNQRLVYHFAKKFHVVASNYDDLISMGTIGLIKAAATFDESKNIKFATYAARCIENEMLMYLRKENAYINDISLDSPINNDSDGNKLTLNDRLADTTKDFTEEIVKIAIFINFISIVLNLLEPRERLIMLHKIAGSTQRDISKILNLSQSYISRLEKKLIKKVKTYLNSRQHFKEVFSMSIVGDSYQISFASKNIKHFNQIFATLLKNVTSVKDLPDFTVSCNKQRILVRIPAHPESFSFIAQIIQEIDEFDLNFVSNKSTLSMRKTVSQNVFSSNTFEVDSRVVETSDENTVLPPNTTLPEKKESQQQKVRDYILSIDSFTVKDLRQHFSGENITTIRNAVHSLKKKNLITPTGRGTYVVNKT